MKGFILSLQSEFYKSRKTLGFWSAIILPVLISLLVLLVMYNNAAKMAPLPGMMLWRAYSGAIINIMGILLPFFVIFIAYSITSVEHKADTWKTLFSLPISKWSVYAAKYFYTVLLIFLCLLLFLLFTIWTGNLLGMLKPELRFADFHMGWALTQVFFKLFLASLGILSIQFLLSLVWADFLKPMGIGFVCTISGMFMVGLNWEYAYLVPYSHPMQAMTSMMPRVKGKGRDLKAEYIVEIFTKELYVGLIVAVIVFITGYYIVQRKSIK
jgi:hypothetical protein